MNGFLKPSKVFNLFIVAEENATDFQVIKCNGFDEHFIQRFDDIPCIVTMRLGQQREIKKFDRLEETPGMHELCDLALRIRSSSVPLLQNRNLPVHEMPSFDRVHYQDRWMAFLRSLIRFDSENEILTIRNSMHEFKYPKSSCLTESFMFDEIRKVAEAWGFNMEGTIFDFD